MADVEKFLTMGLAHGLDPRDVLKVVGGAGNRRIDWTDVLDATAGFDKALYATLMLRAAPPLVHGSHRRALRERLVALVLFDERRRKQRHYCLPEEGVFSRPIRIVDAALAEYEDARVCPECNAHGEVAEHVIGSGVKWVECPVCSGYGWRPWSERRRRVACQGPRKQATFKRYYADSYDTALRELSSLYRIVLAEFKARLFGDDDDSTPGVIERRLQART